MSNYIFVICPEIVEQPKDFDQLDNAIKLRAIFIDFIFK